MEKNNKAYANIMLPYYKQGDDLRSCLVKRKDGSIDTKETLRNHIRLLQDSINMLKKINDIIPDNNDIEIEGDTHYIGINGDKRIIDQLVAKKLANYEHYDNFDDDDVKNDDTDEKNEHEDDIVEDVESVETSDDEYSDHKSRTEVNNETNKLDDDDTKNNESDETDEDNENDEADSTSEDE